MAITWAGAFSQPSPWVQVLWFSAQALTVTKYSLKFEFHARLLHGSEVTFCKLYGRSPTSQVRG